MGEITAIMSYKTMAGFIFAGVGGAVIEYLVGIDYFLIAILYAIMIVVACYDLKWR